MLASHNSMSYLSPTTLWMKMCKPWSKCQNRTIEEQIEKGVRFFDLRILPHRVGNTYEAHFCHNTIDYGKVNLDKSLGQIDKTAVTFGMNFYVRVTLDVRTKPKDANEMSEWFKQYVSKLKELYPNVIFDSVKIFWEWSNDLAEQNVNVIEKHWSVVEKKWYEYIMPIKWFAKNHNQSYITEYDNEYLTENPDTTALMVDYI